jgi:HK97 family phage portal protein
VLDRALSVLSAGLAPRTKANLSPPDGRGGWWPIIRESFAGAWQRNISIDQTAVLANHAVFSCMTLIASDISKLRVKLVQQTEDGIWEETSRPAYSPVLRKPNHFQTRIQFFESWVLSKLSRGNAYILKRRDNRNVVTALYVLDPNRTQPMIAPDGTVYYELRTDNIAGVERDTVLVPASEIIHDRHNCLFHPLVGLSAIFACGLAATQGLKIQENATHLFANASRPGGLLIAPTRIDPENAKSLKEYWDSAFTGENRAKVAVLGDGLQYQSLTVDPVDAQMVEQLKWTAEVVCSTFHVPGFMVGVGQEPSAGGVQDRTLRYYNQALQVLIEAIELLLDEGLGTGEKLGTEFDLDNLLRMDGASQMEMLKNSAGILSPNEQRAKLDKPKVEGGDSPMVQQQNFSLQALAKRDAKDDPFGKDAAATPAPPANDDDDPEAQEAKAIIAGAELRKALFTRPSQAVELT